MLVSLTEHLTNAEHAKVIITKAKPFLFIDRDVCLTEVRLLDISFSTSLDQDLMMLHLIHTYRTVAEQAVFPVLY